MRYHFKTIAAGLALAGLIACQTTPTNKHLHADARPLIKDIDSVLIAKQSTVGADIKTSQISRYLQGHIIPVLIDIGLNTKRSSDAKKHVAPVRETLGDYDYTADIREEFNLALAESGLEGADNLRVLRQEPMGFRTAYIRHSKADAVMFVDVNYAFTPKFDNLNLSSSVMVYPINPALSPYQEKPDTDGVIEYSDNIYRNDFMASIPAPITEASVEADAEGSETGDVGARKTSENAAAWANLSEEELTGKLQAAANQLAVRIAADLSVDELPEAEDEPWDDDSEYLIKGPIDAEPDTSTD